MGIWISLLISLTALLAAYIVTRKRKSKAIYPAPETLILSAEYHSDIRRVLPLQGGINFRDLGGYRTEDGRQVKWEKVYRSGSLAALTFADWEHLNSLNVKLVCDMRSAEEAAAEPDHLTNGIVYFHTPLDADKDTLRRLRMVLFQPDKLQTLMPEMYTDIMLDRNAAVFGSILRRVADPSNLPMVIHCTAGKDRTGMAAALILLVVGVPESVVIADYTLSNHDYSHFHHYADKAIRRLKWLGVSADDLHPLLTADAKTMQHALDHLRQKYGSVHQYLHEAAGLDGETTAKIKENLLEQA